MGVLFEGESQRAFTICLRKVRGISDRGIAMYRGMSLVYWAWW